MLPEAPVVVRSACYMAICALFGGHSSGVQYWHAMCNNIPVDAHSISYVRLLAS